MIMIPKASMHAHRRTMKDKKTMGQREPEEERTNYCSQDIGILRV